MTTNHQTAPGRLLAAALLALVAAACQAPVSDKAEPEASCIDPKAVDRERLCTQQYEPVCGCDGKTYGNACTASGAGVREVTPGRCEDQNGEQ